MNILLQFLKAVLIINVAKCANILGIFPCPGYSQYILGKRILGALAEKNHNITVISDFETKGVSNLRNIVVKNTMKHSSETLYDLQQKTIFGNIDFIYDMGRETVHKFDLVIAEQFYAEALFAFAPYFDAPLVVFNSIGLNEWNAFLVGNPNNPSYVPTCFSGYTSHINFIGRIRNTLAHLYDAYKKNFEALPYYQKQVDIFFPKKINLQDAIYNVSLMLQNSHVSLTEAVPLTAVIKEIGGFHIKEKPLQPNVKEFLDSANHGAVFFSMGSNLQSADLPESILKGILNDLQRIKQRVLWKFERTDIKNIPANVMISKWLPQSDILVSTEVNNHQSRPGILMYIIMLLKVWFSSKNERSIILPVRTWNCDNLSMALVQTTNKFQEAHQNTIAFISHGGLLSTIESMYYGVPMIGVPIFGDQPTNVARIVKFGAGIHLPLPNLGDGSLLRAINEITSNSSYGQNAQLRSKLLRERPVHPLDEAIFWIEHVLQHRGAPYLRNAILDLNWFQVYMIDIAVSAIALFLIIPILFWTILWKLFKKSKVSIKSVSNKKFK